MSLLEIKDTGSAHPWADLRMNNLTVDNNLTVSGTVTLPLNTVQAGGLFNTYIIGATTTTTTPLAILTIPINNNATYVIESEGGAYISTGVGIGNGSAFKISVGLQFAGGVLQPFDGTSPNGVFQNVQERSVGAPLATVLNTLVTYVNPNIIVSVQNAFPGNTTEWLVKLTIIGPIHG